MSFLKYLLAPVLDFFQVNKVVTFLVHFRPLSISMGNAVRWLKTEVAKVCGSTANEDEAKKTLLQKIDTWIHERIYLADDEIVSHAIEKIKDGDVILTHAYSHVVLETLLAAKGDGKKFRYVIPPTPVMST